MLARRAIATSELVYEKACPCPPGMPHVEICCGQQMKKVTKK